MSLAELLPVVQSLPRAERFHLVQVLVEQLAKEDTKLWFREGHAYPIWTPSYSPQAASQLAAVLNQADSQP